MQDLLFDSGHLEKDVVYTPDWCARDMVQHFKPRGRLKFGDATNSAPFPSAVIVFRPRAFALTAWEPEAA